MYINFTLEEIEKIKVNISSFISKMRFYFDEIKNISSDMNSDINSKIRDCYQNLEKVNVDIELAKAVLDNNNKQLERLLSAETRAKKKLETLDKMIKSYTAQFSKLQTKYNGYSDKITKIEGSINTKSESVKNEKDVKAIKAENEKLTKENKAQLEVKAEMEVISKKLKPLEDKKKIIEGCLFAIQREKNHVMELINQIKAIMKDQNNCKDFLNYLLDEMKKFLDSLNLYTQKFETSSQTLNDVMDKIEESFRDANDGSKNIISEITDMLDYMIGQEYRTSKVLFFNVDGTKNINVKFEIDDFIIESQKSFTRISEAFDNFADEFRSNISAIEKSETTYSQNMSDNIQECASELVESVIVQSKEFSFDDIADDFDRLNKYVKDYYNAYDEIRNIYYL